MNSPLIKFIRFAVAGGLSALINIALLYVLVQWLDMWYLAASVVSFIISVGIHFIVQKVWVFAHHEHGTVSVQFITFVSLALINLAINAPLMYICVSVAGINYLVSQVVVRIVLACLNYVAYERLIFKK